MVKRIVQVCSTDFIIDGQSIWFVPMNLPYLIQYDLDTKDVKTKKELGISFDIYRGFFEHFVSIKNSIIGIPYWSKQSFIYDLNEETIDLIEMPDEIKNGDGSSGFYASLVKGNEIVSFTRHNNISDDRTSMAILMELSNRECKSFKLENKYFIPKEASRVVIFRRQCLQSNNSMYLLYGLKNKIFKYELGNKKCEEISVGAPDSLYFTICAIDENNSEYIMADNRMQIVLWEEKKNKIHPIPIQVDGYNCVEEPYRDPSDEPFGFSIKYENSVYFFPGLSNMVIEYNIKTGEVSKAFFSDSICEDNYEREYSLGYICGEFSEPHIYEGILYIWNLWNNKMYMIDIKAKSVKCILVEIGFTESEIRDEYDKWRKERAIVVENEHPFFGLDGFINALT